MPSGSWLARWVAGDIVTAAELNKGVGAVWDSILAAPAASIDMTGLPTTYGHLLVVVYGRGDQAAAQSLLNVRFNGDSAANYDYQYNYGSGATATSGEAFAQTEIVAGYVAAASAGANLFSPCEIVIPYYGNTANNKAVAATFGLKTGTSTGTMRSGSFAGFWRSSAAINRVTLLPASGNFVTGTRATVYVMGA